MSNKPNHPVQQIIDSYELMTTSLGAQSIAIERYEQIVKHGFSLETDAEFYENEELLQAARFCLGVDGWPENWDLHFADKIQLKDP